MDTERSPAPYVVITPAHNEEAFIEKTIVSMISQTCRPLKWIVVNDGSSDRTQEIVERYALQHKFIALLNVSRPEGRHFGNKVHAFNRGLSQASDYDYEYIGNLDADISLANDYYEKILFKFSEDGRLGIAGGMVFSCFGEQYISQEVSPDSVAGAVQMFRRSCFEKNGGYLALPMGGIDAAAEIMARMNGWSVRTFFELRVLEHRRTGTAEHTPIRGKVREGLRLYSLGYTFSFLFLRCIYRLMNPPIVIGSVATLYGYLQGLFRRRSVVLPVEVVCYLRAEQHQKIVQLLSTTWLRGKNK